MEKGLSFLGRVKPRALLRACFSAVLTMLLLNLIATPIPASAEYIRDLHQIRTFKVIKIHAVHMPNPIGDIGPIETVVDLRGFVPMSLIHTLDMSSLYSPYSWFEMPTKKALLILYYGNLSIFDAAQDTSDQEQVFEHTRFLDDSNVTGEYKFWANAAYDLTQKTAAEVYERVIGGAYQSVEPVDVLFLHQSVIILLNYAYSDWTVSGDHGQVLLALEFARSARRYRTLYNLYSTTFFPKSTRQAFQDTIAPVTKTLLEEAVKSNFGF